MKPKFKVGQDVQWKETAFIDGKEMTQFRAGTVIGIPSEKTYHLVDLAGRRCFKDETEIEELDI